MKIKATRNPGRSRFSALICASIREGRSYVVDDNIGQDLIDRGIAVIDDGKGPLSDVPDELAPKKQPAKAEAAKPESKEENSPDSGASEPKKKG